jgi:hypothetical protein
MDSIECIVAILPSDLLASKAIYTSEQLSTQGALFTLGVGTSYPHLSVYMLKIKIKDIEVVKSILAQISGTVTEINLSAVDYHQSRGYVDVEYQKIGLLSNLQKRVIDAINPLRDGMREHDIARLPDATGLMLENYQKYGWNSVGELYRPHLTLTRFSNQEDEPAKLPAFAEFSGPYNRLGLFEMGENGTCAQELFSRQLVV